ncbi:MAG TPA: hypothetical protein VF834_11350 [Streptosporangiaceae bacterium]
MRWPHESAITRRDEHLARTRRLSIRIAGGATAASFGMAAALGFALPGKTATSSAQSPSQPATGTQQGSGTSTGTGTTQGSGHHHHRLSAPAQAPAPAPAPPVVTSGGS